MKYEILKGDTKEAFAGCDFVLKLPEDRVSTEIRILQITDTQIIDSTQCRTPDRLRPDEIAAWTPDRFDGQCGNHIRSLITQAHPDLLIMTGDIIYGSFEIEPGFGQRFVFISHSRFRSRDFGLR